MDYSKSKAHQVVPSAMHLIIFGANYYTLHGLEKFSVQIICRIPQCRFTCHGISARLGKRTIMETVYRPMRNDGNLQDI